MARPYRFLIYAIAFGLPLTLAAQSYVPNRVYDTRRGEFSDFEAMAADLAKADIVFVGEQHDDPNTHRLELAVIEALAMRGRSVILSLEMFERDAQEPLDHFAMGHMAEDEFLKVSRPWPRYATDYKPLVDFAAARDWPVVAANVPRPIASEVAKGGLEVLQKKSAEDRKLFASRVEVPDWRRVFQAVRRCHGRPFGARRLGRLGHRICVNRGGSHDGAVLLFAVCEGRDDGRVDRAGLHGRPNRRPPADARPLQWCVPQ